jgi:hypothetical protein
MGTGGEFRPPSGFLPAGEIGICCSTLRRQRPKGLCQRERSADALVSVVVIEDREQGAIHRSSVGEDAYRSGAPCDFEKAQLHGIGGADGSALGPGLCGANRSGGFTGRGYQGAVSTAQAPAAGASTARPAKSFRSLRGSLRRTRSFQPGLRGRGKR